MGTIGFVILNYKAYEETAACAASILWRQTYPDIQIVIVDNGSGISGLRREIIWELSMRGNIFHQILLWRQTVMLFLNSRITVRSWLRFIEESRLQFWEAILLMQAAPSILTLWQGSASTQSPI